MTPRQRAGSAARHLGAAANHTRAGETLLHGASGPAIARIRQALGAQHLRLRRAEREMEALQQTLAASE